MWVFRRILFFFFYLILTLFFVCIIKGLIADPELDPSQLASKARYEKTSRGQNNFYIKAWKQVLPRNLAFLKFGCRTKHELNQPWKLCARNSIQGFSQKLTKLIIALVLEVLPAKLLGPGWADLFTITSDNSRTYIDIYGYLFFSDIDRTRRSLELGLKGKQEEPRKK